MDKDFPKTSHQDGKPSDFRIVIAGTMDNAHAVWESLSRDVLPIVGKEARRRGIEVIENNLHREITHSPKRKRDILALCAEEIAGYRPIVIGILGMQSESKDDTLRNDVDQSLASNTSVIANDTLEILEIIEGALENPLMIPSTYIYILDENQNSLASEPSPINSRLVHCIRQAHEAGCDPKKFKGLASLCIQIKSDLLNRLEQSHPDNMFVSPLLHTRRIQGLFADLHRGSYIEMPGYFDKIDKCLPIPGGRVVITGDTNVGKSALLVNWSDHLIATNSATHIIRHHIDALVMDDAYELMLRHIMAELKEECKIKDQLPVNVEELAEKFPIWLAEVRRERLLLVLDGLDRLPLASQELTWLPDHFPSNIRLIVSTRDCDALYQLRDRGWPEEQLPS
ncbi:MAG: hypothetical protein ABI876_14415, partial [Bacteroidota bacterium]